MRKVFAIGGVYAWPALIGWIGSEWLADRPLLVGSILFAPFVVLLLTQRRSIRFWLLATASMLPGALALLWSPERGAFLLGVALAMLSLIAIQKLFIESPSSWIEAAVLLTTVGVILLLLAPPRSGGKKMDPTGSLVMICVGGAYVLVGLGAIVGVLAFSTPREASDT